ncbi:YALI0D22044p [Yarrowia lipolytica CLIB122]|uniref:YALI0D22044p n=1 Tax=Yarrowia lipolytica (strain CLIB 122 / E 150) TaxID=284591 RepID=Q6C876_YARLI|nr:YALI0D22044p [Yarrowia lipolytica CLIB122]QNP98019.1 Hypothetical protein YALI2_D00460g [Yarrowia lipolytica]CAG81334.1 YALI0D22044p [Yarrowia lipolytica CLIB122]SEI35255.1 YALIA101S06e05666g1_1 [Yarrowia lipolytica]VBB88385.1 Hypothetical protein conserved in the Yarrowia clade [Yarrowia lipolytica]|eukprot:XP_503136.1 YALI0D22044p [Yarrowia lipolytica CLIB122]
MEEQIQQTTKQVLVGAGHLLAFLSQQGVPMKPLPNPPTLLQSQMDKSVAGFNSALDHMSVNIESALEFLELEKHRLGLVQNEKVKAESEPEVTVKTEPAETEDSKEFTIDGMDASHAIDLDGAFDDFGSNDVDINAMLGDGKDGNKDGIMMDDELSNLLADGENGGGNNAGNTTGIADDDMEGLFGDGFDFVSYDQ